MGIRRKKRALNRLVTGLIAAETSNIITSISKLPLTIVTEATLSFRARHAYICRPT